MFLLLSFACSLWVAPMTPKPSAPEVRNPCMAAAYSLEGTCATSPCLVDGFLVVCFFLFELLIVLDCFLFFFVFEFYLLVFLLLSFACSLLVPPMTPKPSAPEVRNPCMAAAYSLEGTCSTSPCLVDGFLVVCFFSF